MWFGTADGLNRFDGYTFKVLRGNAQSPNSLRNNTVRALLETSDTTLWVGTVGGLHSYDRKRDQFTFLPDNPKYLQSHLGSIINSLVEDDAGNLWVGSNRGITVIELVSGAIREYGITDLGTPVQDQRIQIHRIDANGDIWVSCFAHLFRYRRGIDRFEQVPIPQELSTSWLSLYRDERGVLWLGGISRASRIFWFDETASSWNNVDPFPGYAEGLAIGGGANFAEDKEGRLWIGTSTAGLLWLEQDGLTQLHPFTPGSGPPIDSFYEKVSSMYLDRSGLLWIGYDGSGIVKINPHRNKFQHVLLPSTGKATSGDNFFKAITTDKQERVWLGTYNQGVAILDRKSGGVLRLSVNSPRQARISSNTVLALLCDLRGSIWIGTLTGLDSYNPATGAVRHHRLLDDDPTNIRRNTVITLAEDSTGRIWIGTGTHVLIYDIARDTLETALAIATLDTLNPNANAMCLLPAKEGIWCGTNGAGLLFLSPQGTVMKRYVQQPDDNNSISHNVVKTLAADPRGFLWVGTENGLNRFDPATNTWRAFYATDGLSNDFIYGVLPDDTQHLWVSTNRGITKIDVRNPERPVFRNYTPDDGLQSFEFNTNTYCALPTGELLFGGVNGFNIFHPDSVRDNEHLPTVVLTGLKKFDQHFDTGGDLAALGEIRFEPGESVFSLEFAALEFTNPARNQYAYTMEGFDNAWVFCGTKREARYTNLDPGEYVFKVKGSNNDGIWNEDPTCIRVVVVPPFWKTTWFLGSMIILGAAMFGGGVRYLSTRKLRKRIEALELEKTIQEERLKTRERIARDLHDDLASTVGSAGLFVESVKRQLPDASQQAKEFLNKTSSLLSEAEEAMSDIVWSVSPRHDTLESLVARIRILTADLCKANRIEYEVHVNGDIAQHKISDDLRRNIYLIFKEAVTNAARHAQAERIEIRMNLKPAMIEIEVADNGKGFVPAQSDGAPTKRGHGMRNMRKRAEEIGAALTIESTPGTGTTITLNKRMTQQSH